MNLNLMKACPITWKPLFLGPGKLFVSKVDPHIWCQVIFQFPKISSKVEEDIIQIPLDRKQVIYLVWIYTAKLQNKKKS